MTRKKPLPLFPDSYIGEASVKYDNLRWMERNQKTTSLKCVEYLHDKKLGAGLVHQNSLVLELGCGTGYSSEIFVEYGFNVVALDVLDDMLSKANIKRKQEKLKNLNLILADINHIPIRNNAIDHVVSISAYNFITHGCIGIREERNRANNTAKYIRNVLHKDGRVIIEFYPKDENELKLFISSFTDNGFDGYMIKEKPHQKSGQTFLLLKKE